MKNHYIKDLVLLMCFIGIIYGMFLGARPLVNPDEGRYSEIPREILVTHDYITPHLNNIKYFEKPPLFYWLQAASIKTFGIKEWSLRLVTMLFGIMGALLTYLIARKIFNRSVGVMSALILTTTQLYYVMAHTVTLDMALTFFVTATIYTFLLSTRQEIAATKRLYIYLAVIFAALAVLTKGLIGIILPGASIAIWLFIFNKWRFLKNIYLPTAVLLFLTIVLPWHILAQIKNPEFLKFYFIDQQFLRYSTNIAARSHSNFIYIIVLLIGYLPWSFVLLQTLYFYLKDKAKNLIKYKDSVLLIIWTIFTILFFSFSKSKLPPYILPAFIPLSILTANYLYVAHKKNARAIGSGLISSLIVFSTGFVAWIIFAKTIAPTLAKTILFSSKQVMLVSIIFVLIITGISVALILYRREKFKLVFITIIATFTLNLIPLNYAAKTFTLTSTKNFAATIKPHLKPDSVVISYAAYYQDLPVYLQKYIKIVRWRGELDFGAKHQNDYQKYLINNNTFARYWQNGKIDVYMIIAKNKYNNLVNEYKNLKFYILQESDLLLLLANHGAKAPQQAVLKS